MTLAQDIDEVKGDTWEKTPGIAQITTPLYSAITLGAVQKVGEHLGIDPDNIRRIDEGGVFRVRVTGNNALEKLVGIGVGFNGSYEFLPKKRGQG